MFVVPAKRIVCPLALTLAAAAGQFGCVRIPHQPSAVLPIQAHRAEDADEAEAHRESTKWYLRRHPDGGMRLKAVEEKNRLAPAVSETSGQWSAIGPQPIEWGVPYSGRVWGIAVDPRNSGVVYVGVEGGGVWKTTNGGANWSPLTDTQANINIRDVALAPTAPDIIFAGSAGGGMLKSTDDGATWTTSLPTSWVNSISVHPTDPSIVLIAGLPISSPFYTFTNVANIFNVSRSEDGGSTWITTLSTGDTNAVVFDPSNGNVAYATALSGLYRSADSGITWKPVVGHGLPAGPYSFMTVAIAPSSSNLLYLALKGSDELLLGFYRSADSGSTWTQVGAPPNDNITYWGWSLRVHPTNPNLIYAGSLRLSTSTDGGNTWTNNDNASGYEIHPDHHVQTYSVDGNTLYVGSDGGIWSTTAPAAPHTSWTGLNSTLNTTLFYPGISVSPATPKVAFGGTQDNGVLQYQGDLAWNWATCGDGGYTAIDFVQPQNVYAACSGPLSSTRIFASTDGGNSYHAAVSGIKTQGEVFDYVPPLVMDPSNASRLYFGTNHVYQTLNGAADWTAISPDLTGTNGAIATIAVAPSDPNTVYAGATNNAVFVTQNALSGSSATWITRTPLTGHGVNQISIDPQSPLTAWAAGWVALDRNGTVVGPVYRTVDGGATWASLSVGLPNLPANDVLLDPDIPNTIYTATDVGVYRSVDSGQSWLPLGTGLPNVIVHSLRLYRPTRTLRAATYGRGMWDLSVPTSGQTAVTIAATTAGAAFSLEDGTTYQAPCSFYWYTGAQHTVTWLNGAPGARYLFSGWTDGVAQNTRTIVVPSSPSTYTAMIGVQYLLTVASSPSLAGTVTVNPSSPDGYYNAGTTVQISAAAAAGYAVSGLGGDLSGSLPQSITMNSPHSITVTFGCSYTFPYFPDELGSGSTSGFFQIQAGSTCPWSLTPGADWLTVRSATSGIGPAMVAYALDANDGASRSTNLTIGGKQLSVSQDASSTGRPSAVSMVPNSGMGAAQSFTYQFQYPNGYAEMSSVFIRFEKGQNTNPACDISLAPAAAGQYELYLLSDDGSAELGPVLVAGAATVQNSQCILDAGKSSVSGAGNLLNVTVALTFKPSFSGGLLAGVVVFGPAGSASEEMLGTWVAYPAASSPPAAVVVSSVVNGASYLPAIGPNTWVTIQGTNLSQSTRPWGAGDFVNGLLPKSLDGVSVTIDGKPAFVSYISPTQVNVLAPDDTKQGTVPVVVSNSAGASNTFTASFGSVSPAFFTFDSMHVAATHADGTDIGAPNSIPGVKTTPAAPGETIVMYATGLGTTNPPVATGTASTGVAPLATPISVISIGGVGASASFSGLIGPGLYQLNVVVPNTPGGDVPIVAQIGGAQTQTGVVINIQP
jgi:uncharacterized protein (TIGR03437 family)